MNKKKLNTNKKYIYTYNNGITLIALIITIIVMLILLGVTVTVGIGNGLFTTTKKATTESQRTIDREQLQLSVTSSYDKNGYLDVDKLNKNLPEGFTEKDGVYKSENGNLFLIEDDQVKDARWRQNEDGSITNGEITLQIGDYVNYKPNTVELTSDSKIIKDLQSYSGYKEAKKSNVSGASTEKNTENQIYQEDLKWRVLDVENGRLRLISEKPSNFEIYFYGYNGYNNCVYLLDEVCKELYSSYGIGTAQNLKRKDIESKINTSKYDYTTFVFDETSMKYGDTTEYRDGNRYYPAMFTREQTGWINDMQGSDYDLDEQEVLISQTAGREATNSLKVTQTAWNHPLQEDYWINPTYHNIFIKDITSDSSTNYETYWLSTRCVHTRFRESDSFYCHFEIANVMKSDGGVSHSGIYFSKGTSDGFENCIRPVTVLNSEVEISKEKVDNVWQIKQ